MGEDPVERGERGAGFAAGAFGGGVVDGEDDPLVAVVAAGGEEHVFGAERLVAAPDDMESGDYELALVNGLGLGRNDDGRRLAFRVTE